MNQRYSDKRLSDLGGRRNGIERYAAKKPASPSEVILVEIRRQFYRFSNHRNEWGDLDFELTLNQFISLWRPHWRNRRTMKLVLCKRDFTLPFDACNSIIDTRANQIKRQWAAYRKRLGREKPGDHEIEEADGVKCDETHIDTK
jgi:hypothetical protein